MATNIGKVFEEQIKKSVPEYALLYRLPDAAQAFGGGSSLRFSYKNPFDFLLWDSLSHTLYALEMKTVNGKSISFERTKEDYGDIHFHQINGLSNWNKYDGIICGFIIEFRELEKTIFLDISDFNMLVTIIQKKSFCYNDLHKYNIKHTEIQQTKARSRYTYNINNFLLHNQQQRKLEENDNDN